MTEQELHDLAARSPVVWFCVLEAARNRGDVALARKAQKKLRSLGVKVVYQKRPNND